MFPGSEALLLTCTATRGFPGQDGQLAPSFLGGIGRERAERPRSQETQVPVLVLPTTSHVALDKPLGSQFPQLSIEGMGWLIVQGGSSYSSWIYTHPFSLCSSNQSLNVDSESEFIQ